MAQWRADWLRLKDVKEAEIEEREGDEYDIAASNQKEKFDMAPRSLGETPRQHRTADADFQDARRVLAGILQ